MKLGNSAPWAVMSLAVFVASGILGAAVVTAAIRRKEAAEAAIDERIADSFPASDPPWQP